LSGIFGLWRLDGRVVRPAVLERMSRSLAHRGPDGSSIWGEGPVGLGHRMFHATPESRRERQPMVVRDGDLVLTADARLDNREELIRTLGFDHRPSGEVTDPDLILGAYERWGSRCPERLLGDFAFAIWDRKRQIVVCARDHFGIKPLYYFHAPGKLLAFASEVKALLTLEEVPDAIDELEAARHLLIPIEDDPRATFYRDVKRVQPGHELTMGRGSAAEREYWALDPHRSLNLGSDSEYAEAVREAFVEAVRCRLRSSSEVACMLSGGLDSSSITCTAAKLLAESGSGRPLRTLSAVYETASASDERMYIDEVPKAYQTDPHFFAADSVSPVAELDRLSWLLDRPNESGNLYVNWNLYRSAAGLGNRVVLDGFDGDTTLSHGQGRLIELALARKWWTLAREVKAKAGSTGEPWKPAVYSWIRFYGIKPAIRKLTGASKTKKTPSKKVPGWTRVVPEEYRSRLASHIYSMPPRSTTEREHHYGRLSRVGLRKTVGTIGSIGSGAGVDVRFPFFDIRLVELCLSLPPEQKLRRGLSRYVMRNAMEGILPERIRWRPGKSDISVGFHHALRSLAGDKLEQVVACGQGELAGFIDPQFITSTYPKFMNGSASKSDELYFWRSFSLALWVMGRRGAADVDGGSHPNLKGPGSIRHDKPPKEVSSAR
jgi:asparagine synthase (glutamine-hydrolysing)